MREGERGHENMGLVRRGYVDIAEVMRKSGRAVQSRVEVSNISIRRYGGLEKAWRNAVYRRGGQDRVDSEGCD